MLFFVLISMLIGYLITCNIKNKKYDFETLFFMMLIVTLVLSPFDVFLLKALS